MITAIITTVQKSGVGATAMGERGDQPDRTKVITSMIVPVITFVMKPYIDTAAMAQRDNRRVIRVLSFF